jgi:hypothetical protein
MQNSLKERKVYKMSTCDNGARAYLRGGEITSARSAKFLSAVIDPRGVLLWHLSSSLFSLKPTRLRFSIVHARQKKEHRCAVWRSSDALFINSPRKQ